MFKVPTKIKIDHSEGKGLGVFATEKILKGEIIEECHYVVIPSGGDILVDYRFLLPATNEYIIPLGYGCIYNHADASNASWKFPTDHKAVAFFAKRDIEVGEEICTYYGGKPYWDARNCVKI